MKRFSAALLIAVAVILIGLTGNRTAVKYYGVFSEEINECEALYRDGGDAETFAKELENKWAQAEKRLVFFQNRDTVDELGRSFTRLCSYAETKNDALFFTECRLIRLRLLEIKQSEEFSFETLF